MRPTDEFLAEYAGKEAVQNEDEPYLMQTMNEVDLFRLELGDGKLMLKSSAQAFAGVFARAEAEHSYFPFAKPLFTKDISDFDGCWYPYIVELYSFPFSTQTLQHTSSLEIEVKNGLVNCEAMHLQDTAFVLKDSKANKGTLLVYETPEPIDYFSVFADVIEPDEVIIGLCDDRLTLICGRYLVFYCERAADDADHDKE